MFSNQVNPAMANLGAPPINAILLAVAQANQAAVQSPPTTVKIADIYQAAKNRAVEDHELDKLFNPEHYDFQI